MDLRYRPLRKSDYTALQKIICEAWDFSAYVKGAGTLRHYQDIFLSEYLARSNYTEAAVLNGSVVGFLLGRCDKVSCAAPRRKHAPLCFASKLALLFSRSGRFALRILRITDHVNRKLIKDHANDFDGELCLFAVTAHLKKQGIGRELLSHFHVFMRSKGAENYFLYTDTYCNVGFYERMGYALVSLDTVDFGSEWKELPKYLLYTYDLSKNPQSAEICE